MTAERHTIRGLTPQSKGRHPMRQHWRMNVELVTDGDPRILGEDENGRLFVPSRSRGEFWDRPFDPRKPSHWPFWLRSRRTRRVAFLESVRRAS